MAFTCGRSFEKTQQCCKIEFRCRPYTLCMKFRLYYPLLILFFFSLASACRYTRFQPPEKSVNEKISDLGQRYFELGRFSGSIFVENRSEPYYRSFGYANFETQKSFNQTTVFKVGTLTKLVEQLSSDEGEKDRSYFEDVFTRLKLENSQCLRAELPANAAIGHLYINQGQGLEWTKSPQLAIDETPDECIFATTGPDILTLLDRLSEPRFAHDGYLEEDGFSYSAFKEGPLKIVILSNNRHPVAAEMTNSIRAIVNKDDYELPLLRLPKFVDVYRLSDFAGSYQLSAEMTFDVSVEDEKLLVQMGPQKLPLIHQGEEQFYLEETDAALRFKRDKNGKVDRVILFDGFLEGKEVKKVDKP